MLRYLRVLHYLKDAPGNIYKARLLWQHTSDNVHNNVTALQFFCQEHFTGAHLASITSQYIHRKVMSMMLQQNGAFTRTWIGGLRYLEVRMFRHIVWFFKSIDNLFESG